MAVRPYVHADRAKAALRAIMDDPDLGVEVLSSGRLAANVFEDLLPDAPRERAILVLAAQAGVVQALRDHVTQGLDHTTAIRLAVSSLEDNSPLDHDSCEWVVTQIAAATGMTATPAPTPAADQDRPEQATRLRTQLATTCQPPSPPSRTHHRHPHIPRHPRYPHRHSRRHRHRHPCPP